MTAAILNIGDELLIGDTINTNASWIAQQLDLMGISVQTAVTVGDNKEHIKAALERLRPQAIIILITGGLGPTNDDLTKVTLAEYFGVKMRFVDEIYTLLKDYFEKRYPRFLEQNRSLAEIPENAEVLINKQGTAAGMWFEEGGNIIVSMPGVPNEMKGMMQESILPRIKERFELPVISHKYILTAGVGESYLAEKLKQVEEELPVHIKLAYLPGLGVVRLRLSGSGENRQKLEEELEVQQKKVDKALGHHIYGYDNDLLASVFGNLLKKNGKTVCTAESCTGGFIAHSITEIPGSSKYFLGSVVAYSNEIKEKVLGVKSETLKAHGAVSEETVKEMAAGALETFGADYTIAVSGIAGPSGGSPEKPVGTVWIAYGGKNDIQTKQIYFPGERLGVIKVTSVIGINLLRRYLCKAD